MTISREEASWQRLNEYANDLRQRFDAQKSWQERNHGINPFNPEQYTDEFHARDPYPLTTDLISAERFLDILTIAIAAYERVFHG